MRTMSLKSMWRGRRIRRLLSRWLPPLAVFAAVGGLYVGGLLEFLEYRLLDARFQILERAPSDSLVLVDIDAASLGELPTWPWPRSLHAQVLRNLGAAGADQVALDIDFSAQSSPAEDSALAEALRAADPPVILPVFMQPSELMAEDGTLVLNAPLPAFAEHADLASINLTTASDGRVRRIDTAAPWGKLRMPTLFARLARRDAGAVPSFYIDYGIQPARITRLSYADVLTNRFEPGLIEGGVVLVGASALELGDRVPVPLHGALPGMVVQALAYESLIQDRALQRIAPEINLALLLATAILAMAWMKGRSWRGGLTALVIGAAALLWISVTLQAALPVILDTVPLLIALALCFLVAQLGRLDRLARRTLGYRRVAERRAAVSRDVSEGSFDGVLALDRTGLVISANPAAARMFGEDSRLLVGRPVLALLPDLGRPGGADRTASRLPRKPRETLALRKGGDRFPVQVAARGQAADRAVLLVRDLSAQRAAEAAAVRAENRLLDLAERLDEGVALYDRRDRLRLCNSRYRALMLGPGGPDPTGLRFTDVLAAAAKGGALSIPAERRPTWHEEWLRRHRRANNLYEEPLADGRVLQISESRTLEGGTLVLCSDNGRARDGDLGPEQAVPDAESARRAQSEFLANVGHELRTPLNAIIGFSEVMLDEILGPLENDSYKEYLRDIHGSGKHLLSVINDILDVSRIEQGRYTLEEEYLDLRALTEDTLRVAGDGAAGKHEITVEIPDHLPALHADERAVKQILRHILGNAVKFSRPDSPITVRAALDPKGNLVVKVSDSGIGIDPSKLEAVTSFFGQAEPALSRSYEGLGLGLPLAKSLMALHGGSIALDSAPDRGTVVTLTFPACRLRQAALNVAQS